MSGIIKTHPLLFKTAAEILFEVFSKDIYADKVLDRKFKSLKKLGSRDRRFISDIVYESIRWIRKLTYGLGMENFQKLNTEQYFKILAYQFFQKEKQLPEFLKLFAGEFAAADAKLQLCTDTAILGSAPDWLDEIGKAFFAEQWLPILNSLNQMGSVDLRVNTLKIQKSDLLRKFSEAEILVEAIPELESGLTLKVRKNIFNSPLFLEGFFEVQDRASQLVAPLLELQPGMTLVDACAGAGGKSLHAAALQGNQGSIFAFDVHQWKLDELQNRAVRNGVKNIKTKLISDTLPVEFQNRADRLLLDVPCSGTGTFRRQPDAKWKFTKGDLDQVIQLQQRILNSYERILKVGGMMVYATCSFLPLENQLQIENWMQQPNQLGRWQKLKEIKVLPNEGRGDGFYAVQLIKLKT